MYVRKPAVAGQFYSSDPQELAEHIEHFLQSTQSEKYNDITAIVVPHAGYVFSGSVAASAFASVRGASYDTVMILAPSHRYRIPGASVMTEGVYKTPIGETPVDSSVASLLRDDELFIFAPEIHETEHSLEVQVPFVQTVFPTLPIIPVIVGTTDVDRCQQIGRRAADLLLSQKKNPLIVISTDLSHYLSYDQAVETDARFCQALESCDIQNIQKSIESGMSSACGYGPVVAGITAAQSLGASHCRVIDYRNSGDTAGSKSQVVGYCAALITRE